MIFIGPSASSMTFQSPYIGCPIFPKLSTTVLMVIYMLAFARSSSFFITFNALFFTLCLTVKLLKRRRHTPRTRYRRFNISLRSNSLDLRWDLKLSMWIFRLLPRGFALYSGNTLPRTLCFRRRRQSSPYHLTTHSRLLETIWHQSPTCQLNLCVVMAMEWLVAFSEYLRTGSWGLIRNAFIGDQAASSCKSHFGLVTLYATSAYKHGVSSRSTWCCCRHRTSSIKCRRIKIRKTVSFTSKIETATRLYGISAIHAKVS